MRIKVVFFQASAGLDVTTFGWALTANGQPIPAAFAATTYSLTVLGEILQLAAISRCVLGVVTFS
jgi:hypothetical protein